MSMSVLREDDLEDTNLQLATGIAESTDDDSEPPATTGVAAAQHTRAKSNGRNIIILLTILPFINFASSAIITPMLELFREIVCGVWYMVHGSDLFENHERNCHVEGVASWYSGFVTALGAIEAVGALIVLTFIGRNAGVIGRKPLLVIFLFLDALGTIALPVATWFKNDILALIFLSIFVFKGAVVSLFTHFLLVNMMIVDWTEAHERSRYLLIALGLGALGRAPAYFLGPMFAAWLDSPKAVFYLASALIAISGIIIGILLPESLPKSSRSNADGYGDPDSSGRDSSRASSTRKSEPKAFSWSSIIAPLLLLKILFPTRDPETGRVKKRLLLLAMSYFLGHMVSLFIVQGCLIYAVVIFNLESQETGYILTLISVVQIVWNLVLCPPIIQGTQNLYLWRAKEKHELRHTEYSSNGDSERAPLLSTSNSLPQEQVLEELKASAVGKSDVHIAAASHVMKFVSMVLVGLAKSPLLMVIGISLHSITHQGESSTRAAMTVSVPPNQHGEVLSALELALSVAQLTSPIQGLILTLLINKAPQIAFFFSGSLSLVAAVLLLFVRDSERYKPRTD